MQCPKCQFQNPDGLKFCNDCGQKLTIVCPSCQSVNQPGSKFCGDCGYDFTKTSAITPQPIETPSKTTITDQERKHVTVMFSDLSGYTAMTEKLDPEEVKEIMDRIFGKISQVVVKYEGFIEKFVGDAVMAIFGVPKTHEDDPVRAIRAAREIHSLVKEISPSLEKRVGRPLYMHTGINTGLVVAKEIDFEKGTHGVLGDTINVASRISGLAKADEIIVGLETYHQAEGYFNFEKLDPAKVKGKEEPIQIYKVSSPKEAISKTHRLSGLRSELIGRKAEMDQLKEAVDNLKKGKSSSFSIIGDAGTGKSRLVEEFRNSLDMNTIQWREGHSYGYSQNIPYFPVIDLLSRAWQIKEGDPPDQTRQKVEKGAGATLGERKDLIPYIGNLYSLSYPEIETVPPEQWKARLHEAINLILANLCKHAPTIICIEDLHWADPSTVELLRNILIDLKYPVIFLCIYRPSFNLFTSHQAGSMKSYHEIRLQDLTPTDAQNMVESLLSTKTIPRQLQMFVRDKAEGNPFYLEEVINSLIETDTLIKDKDSWKLTRTLIEKDIPSTIQGVISARLDRLERETKRILQEASVIGRAFLYEILKRISDLKEYIDKSLMNLERLDLIKTRSLQPELEYIFKHALTQEVVYNGLLIKERRSIHEKIGLVMEELFHDYLPEFYETLAYHYSQSDNFPKAYEYLKLSCDKAAKNYSNWEAIRFFKEAIRVLDTQPVSEVNQREKLNLSLSIYNVLFILGFPEGTLEILHESEKLAQDLNDERSILTVFSRIGHYYSLKGNPSLGIKYSEKSLDQAEKMKDIEMMTQTARYLCLTYFTTGNYINMLDISNRTINLIEEHQREKDLYFGVNAYSVLCGWYGYSLGFMGKCNEVEKIMKKGLKIAHECNDRYGMGYLEQMYAITLYFLGYDGSNIIDHAQKCIKYWEEGGVGIFIGLGWIALGAGYSLLGEYEIAKAHVSKGLNIQKKVGQPFFTAYGYTALAMTHFIEGDLVSAKECAEEALKHAQEGESKNFVAISGILLGRISGETDLTNIDEAQRHILHGISILEELGIKLMSTMGYLHLGEFLANAGRKEEALESLKKAEALYREMEIIPQSYWLTRTKDALKKLGQVSA